MDYQVSVMARHCHGHITHAWGETTSKSDTDMNQGPTKATKYAVKQSAVQLSWKPLCGKCQVFTGQLWFFQGTTIWSVHGYMNFQCMVTWQLVCATICKLHILTMVFALIWGSEKKRTQILWPTCQWPNVLHQRIRAAFIHVHTTL
jgi:hypothetical protein